MKITICGSMHHIKAMQSAAETLRQHGHSVNTPEYRENNNDHTLSDEELIKLRTRLIRDHLDKINASDAVLIFNEEKNGMKGYVGGSVLIEMAFAFAGGIKLYMLNPAPEITYRDEIRALEPIVLNGNLSLI